jgi:hypothetical protein
MDLLDRVIDVTEHHDHALPEQPIEQWNSRTYKCDLTRHKQELESQFQNGVFQIKGSTPTMFILTDAKNILEMRIVFEPNGSETTRVVITCQGAQGDITEEAREAILALLDRIDAAVKIAPKPTDGSIQASKATSHRMVISDRKFVFIVIVIVAGICWFFAIIGRVNDKPQAAVTQPTPSVTPMPSVVRRRMPHKAERRVAALPGRESGRGTGAF